MHFLNDYGMFLAKAFTIVIALLIFIGGIIYVATKNKEKEKSGKLIIQKLNDQFENYLCTINQSTLSKKAKKQFKKQLKQKNKSSELNIKKRLFVLNFEGDIKASSVNSLREEISAIILAKKLDDEVLLRVDSPGGMVHAYGLAAAQIERLKDAKIKLTVAVDKVAASGGYLMACLADHILSAPFAIVGSIGVIAQLPNFNRWLEKNDIDFEQISAGQYKRTLSLFGKNTVEGRNKMQAEVNEAHEYFKIFISRYRPQVDINSVATGEHWFGMRALELKLIDEIKTSDEYLLNCLDQFDMYQVKYAIRKKMFEKFGATMANLQRFLYGT